MWPFRLWIYTLAARAHDYAAAGLRRVNLSLDSLDRRRIASITGVDGLDRVLRGIDTALDVGLTPLRLNTVVMRGVNDHELSRLVQFAAAKGVEIRFIELMPMGPLADVWPQRYVSEVKMRDRLAGVVTNWQALRQGSGSARRYRVSTRSGRSATVGFITPMSCNFCAACSRIRVTADGGLYPCLMDQPAGSLMPAIRPSFDADHFDTLLSAGLAAKRAEHPVTGFVTMTHIGG